MLEKAPGKLKAIGNGGVGSKFGDVPGNSSSTLSAAQKRQRGPLAVGAGRPTAGADLLVGTNAASRRGDPSQNRVDGQRRAHGARSSRPRNMLSAKHGAREADKSKSQVSINDYDRKADRSAATKTKVANMGINGDESSDQKMVMGLSGQDDSEHDHFNSIMNIPHNENEIMDFECFMNGIQNKLEEKEQKKKRKLERLLGGLAGADAILAAEVAGLHRNQLDLFVSDDSSSGSSDEETLKS